MQQAHGEYLFFVDADDILVPNTLRSCLPLLKLYSPDILRFGFKEFTSASSLEKQNPTNQLPSYVEYSSGAHFMALNNFYGSCLGCISSVEVYWRRLLFILVRQAFLKMKSLLPKLTSSPEKCW